jgi:hypothetical protein
MSIRIYKDLIQWLRDSSVARMALDRSLWEMQTNPAGFSQAFNRGNRRSAFPRLIAFQSLGENPAYWSRPSVVSS